MKKNALTVILIVAILQACKAGIPSADESSQSGALPDWDTTTTFFEEQNGWFVFKTSEPAYINTLGRNFWLLDFYTSNSQISATLKKNSGMAKYGYGLAFEIEDMKNFMIILIDTNKNYTVGQVIGGNFRYLDSDTWLNSNHLIAGLNVLNTVRVDRIDEENFSIYFNDKLIEKSFKYVTSSPNPKQFGLVVTIGPEENFPRQPVEVSFQVS